MKGVENIKEREYEWLCQIIAAIGSSKDLSEVLSLAVDVATRAAGCQDCFLYLWNARRERLIVSASSAGLAQFIHQIELRLGEGIIGWVAQHQQPVLIEADAIKDPRFKFIPGLNEEEHQSSMTVPIVSSVGELVGVFAMNTYAPNKFSEESLQFVQKVAMLVSGLIEKSRLYDQMQRTLVVKDALANLSKTLLHDHQLESILRCMTDISMKVVENELCTLFLLSPDKSLLSLEVWSSTFNFPSIHHWSIEVNPVMKEWLVKDGNRTGMLKLLPSQMIKPFVRDFSMWACSIITCYEDPLGLLLCFRKQPLLYTDEDLVLLDAVADQGALAITRERLIAEMAESQKKANYFDSLIGGTYSHEHTFIQSGLNYGIDLTKKNLVAVVDVTVRTEEEKLHKVNSNLEEVLRRSLNTLGYRLEKSFSGGIYICRENILQAILPVSGDMEQVCTKIAEIKTAVENIYPVELAVGIGNVCSSIISYRQSYEEAKEALCIGRLLLWNQQKVFRFNDLGLYRYLYKLWINNGVVRDSNQEAFEKLLSHDRENGPVMLDTLEKYLECMGRVGEAAKKLYVHRNTLYNRLEKISTIMGVDIFNTKNWFSLYIELKITKIRNMNRPSEP